MFESLDQTTRDTIGRFSIRLAATISLAAVGRQPFLLSAAFLLVLYGLCTALIAALRRLPIERRSLTAWDEVVMFTGLSLLFLCLHRSQAIL